LQFLSGEIPAFTRGRGIFYTIKYRSNMTNPPRIMASNIPADRPFLIPTSQLRNGEIITEIIIEFDAVPAGFSMDDTIVYRFLALDENNTTNRWDVVLGEINNRNFFIGAALHNIDRISNLENRYDAASWANFQAVSSYVQSILRDPNSTLEDVEAAYLMLQQAINELNPVATTTPFALARIFAMLAVSILSFFALMFLLLKLIKKKRILIRALA